MTTYEASNAGAVPDVPPAPEHAPQGKAKPSRFAGLRSADGARIVLGTLLALLLMNDIAVVQAAQNSYIAGSSMRNGNLLFLIGVGIAGELIIRGVERANRQRTSAL